MDWIPTDQDGSPRSGFKLASIQDLQDLESGSYWPQLRPYFLGPEYHRIRYSILGKSAGRIAPNKDVSVRGASKAGELEVAFVADSLAARMSITGIGIPDYCLTVVGKGVLTFSEKGKVAQAINPKLGLIYRGMPETDLTSTGSQERVAIWIPQASLTQRLSALMDAPVPGGLEFHPVFQWDRETSTVLRHLVNMLMVELQAPTPTFLGNEAANRSFSDLLIYTLLRSVTHNYSDQLERPNIAATPGILRRAEAYIRAHVEDPIALHDVAAAAGCSVRSLQHVFRNFRDTTPLLAIRQFRLEAAREALRSSDAEATLTAVALRFGFSNPGRFTRFYKAAFGEAPLQVMSRRRA
jgi:AraC-like DNA-binding protein